MQRSIPFNLALLAAVSLSAVNAHASNRVLFDLDTLGRVQKVENGLDRVRVYPSRRFVIQRSTGVGSQTSVDGSIDTVLEGKVRKDVVARGAAGKILAVEPVTHMGDLPAREGAYRLFVSFDPSCTSHECAFAFENPMFRQLSLGGTAAIPEKTYFMLAGIPAAAGATQIDAIWMGRKPIFWLGVPTEVIGGAHSNVFDAGTGDVNAELVLEVKLNELVNIEKETVKHGGWND